MAKPTTTQYATDKAPRLIARSANYYPSAVTVFGG
jgi:hypothetical protein